MRSDQFLNAKARPLGDNAEVRRKLIVVADEDFAGLALDLYSVLSSKQSLDRVLNRLVVGDSGIKIDQHVHIGRYGLPESFERLCRQGCVQAKHESVSLLRNRLSKLDQQPVIADRPIEGRERCRRRTHATSRNGRQSTPSWASCTRIVRAKATALGLSP